MRRPGPRGAVLRAVLAATLLASACATGALREAKNAYNRGDFVAAREAARRAAGSGEPQARLIAARAGIRLLDSARDPDTLALARIAADLRAASRGYPFAETWADRELAAGTADWLALAGLPELAAVYYRAALEAPGGTVDPGEAAAAEGWVQSGLEALDRWDSGSEKGRAGALRELERPLERLMDDCGWPYPAGLADQALRVAWHRGDFRAAWEYGAAGWLHAVAEGDDAAAAALDSRLTDLVFPEWRSAANSALVDAVAVAWGRVQNAWSAPHAPVRSQAQEHVLAIRNFTVIDATGAAPRPHMTVVVDGSRIAVIGQSDEFPASVGIAAWSR